MMNTNQALSQDTSAETELGVTPQTLNPQLASSIVANYEEYYEVLRGATVMMVDDEPTTIDVLQAFLENEGYQRFITTTESNCALDLLGSENPDVVLLDLHMPGINGFDILSSMRRDQRYRHTPVIVLTSATDSDTKLKALQLGASDFLAKPVDPSELALRLRNTLAAKAYQDRLTFYDALTGLPNRRMFTDRLVWSLRCAKRDGTLGAVLHIDLDHFQKINDSLGHAVGDTLLVSVGQRLLQYISADGNGAADAAAESQTLVSRVGGDEFNVLVPEIARIESPALMAAAILEAMREPFQVNGHEVFITPSLGIAVFPNDGEDSDSLLQHVGVAMTHAKQRGRNAYEFYSDKMDARARERLSLETKLRRAIERDELMLLYQPKVNFTAGRIVGAEALLRWHHPELGMVPPIRFIPLLEESGMIVSFGEWVLRTACRQNKAWQSAGFAKINVAVNVSARQFRDGQFIQTLEDALHNSGLDPQYLTLELTENTIMENAEQHLEGLRRIRAMGVKLSVDDFGTGYSSLSYLKQLPLHELKVDRSFIMEIRSAADDAPIVTAIIGMAHSLGLKVVIEGIETEPQLAFARDRGCDEYQGYLFSKPVACNDFEAMLRASS
jgi:diguanylate cyclase (GGDEF)-like protein